MSRVVGHIDLDYFYAQVEEVLDPSIKGRPVIVCVFSGRTEDSGVVSTANYKARDLGVHSGMPIVLAKKKLRGANPAIIRMEHVKYEVVSTRIMQTVKGAVDALEQTGIDEAFFDLTPTSQGDYQVARKVAEGIKETILHEEGLTCSIGLGRSKVVAKLGSDMAKPGGLIVVEPSTTEAFLRNLPASRLYGVGPKTSALLEEMGIKTVGELSSADPQKLEEKLGKKFSSYLLLASTGSDDDPVLEGLEPTQFSRIITLRRDTRDPEEIVSQLRTGIEDIRDKLATTNKSFKTISAIGILSDLSIHTKSKTLGSPASDSPALEEDVSELFTLLGKSVSMDLRRAGIRISGLIDKEDQRSLFDFLQSR